MADGDPDATAHLTVRWENAISPRGNLTCCYGDPATAVRDAWSHSVHVANNTRVTVYWHPGHAATRRREAEYAAHAHPPPHGVWACRCTGPCLVSQHHRAEKSAELAAAASDVIPANGPDGQLARLPRRHAVPVLWEPPADLLAAPRRGPILVTSRDVSPHVLSEAIRLLQHGLAGSVAVADAGVSQRPGQTIASAGSELRPVMTPLRAPNFYSADGARCRSRDTPAGKQAPLPGGQRPERGKEMSR